MNPTEHLLSFTNVLEAARLHAAADSYELQEELVQICRAKNRAFIASMPMRHRFQCPTCGIQSGEILLHFEDPKQPLRQQAERGMWGISTGHYFEIQLSELHSALAHGGELPQDLAKLLQAATP